MISKAKHILIRQWFLIPPLLAILATGYVAIAVMWFSYEPFKFYGYDVMPEATCPGGEISLVKESELTPLWHSDVNKVQVVSQWRSGNGVISSAGSAVLPTDPYPRGKRDAFLARELPMMEGEWNLQSTYTITGDVWGIPREQTVFARSKDILIVLPGNDPRCN